jgi:hypothetical protein
MRHAAACCVLAVWAATVATAQEPPDPIFWDGFDPCPAATGECDGDRAIVCETSLDTTTDCGGCGVTCDLANASESCGTGTCEFEACSLGFATCDGDLANGCEVQISGHSNAFPGEDVGDVNADTPGCSLVVTRSERRGRFFIVDAREAVGGALAVPLELRFDLASPAGVDYDLLVTLPAGATCPGGCEGDLVRVSKADIPGDSSFTVLVEVRYRDGVSCQQWTLNVSGGADCVPSP